MASAFVPGTVIFSPEMLATFIGPSGLELVGTPLILRLHRLRKTLPIRWRKRSQAGFVTPQMHDGYTWTSVCLCIQKRRITKS
jgi:hypothetical protein